MSHKPSSLRGWGFCTSPRRLPKENNGADQFVGALRWIGEADFELLPPVRRRETRALGALVPAVAGLSGPAIVPLIAGQLATSIGATIWSVNQMSLRQHLTDVSLLGRVTAARRFLVLGAAPLGAAVGGVLGGGLGLRTTLVADGLGPMVALLLIFFCPIRAVRDGAAAESSA